MGRENGKVIKLAMETAQKENVQSIPANLKNRKAFCEMNDE